MSCTGNQGILLGDFPISNPLGPIADLSVHLICGFFLGSHVQQRTDIVADNLLVLIPLLALHR